MKNNKVFIISIIILIGLIYFMVENYSLKTINKENINVSEFINIVDEVSGNKAQINWQYVAAIEGVIKKNNFKKVEKKDIKDISKLFLKGNGESYTLSTVDEVLNILKFNEKQRNLTYEYINQLKSFGIVSQRLNEDSKYMKFINSIKDEAIQNYKNYKILPSITIAQAILESGWGEAKLAKEYNNLFGIKADIYWKGNYVTLETREFKSDIENEKFRKYEDIGDSIKDHGKFLSENNRYSKSGVFRSNTYIHQANALQDGGYSTDTNEKGERVYSNRLIEIIKQYNLQLIDSKVQSNKDL